MSDPNVRPCNGPHCDALVRWVITLQGKRMPLELEPDEDDGNVYMVDVAGTQRARVLGGGDHRPPDDVPRCLSHWVKCPDSEIFRRRAAAAVKRCHACQHPLDPVLAETDIYHPGCAPEPNVLRAAAERAADLQEELPL